MLLVFLLVSTVIVGSCFGEHVEACYGKDLLHSTLYTPPLYTGPLYFTPSEGGPHRVVIENGQSKDPRYQLGSDFIQIQSLTEKDNGYFSITNDGINRTKIFDLKILDCAGVIERKYGSTYRYIMSKTFDILEFSPLSNLTAPKILWNRTNPDLDEDHRISVSTYVVSFHDLTQEHNGFYNFKDGNNVLVLRLRLTVKEAAKTKHIKESTNLVLEYTETIEPWIVTFIPEGRRDSVMRISDGVVTQDDWFNGRIQVVGKGIEITPVKRKDSGTFRFEDAKGNLALTVEVVVVKSETNSNVIYYSIGGVLCSLTVIRCCYSCCCGKTSKKNETAGGTAESPDANDHGDGEPAQPGHSAPLSSFSYQPVAS